MLKFICSIPPAIGWVLVGIVACLCVLMFVKLLVFIFGEIRKHREEEHRKNSMRILYLNEEFEVRASFGNDSVDIYVYEINPKTNKAKCFPFVSQGYWLIESERTLTEMAVDALQEGLRERAKQAHKEQMKLDLEKINTIVITD